jgi:penicillin-binding protein 2
MDINSGEILAMVSFPEYDSTVLTIGKDKSLIDGYFANKNNPFLNRVTSGLFTPGSIVKPFVAFAALEEKIIDPLKQIESTGQLVLPNPYNPSNPSIFKDWKAHGFVDVRRAIAVSSDVYFYQIGGGFGNQKGLGIEKLEKYFKIFGFGEATGIMTDEEENGVIPNPKWKEDNFDGEIWRIGNTYHTAIGQYGMQITPIQAVRAVAALANGGYLVTPSLLFSATSSPQIGSRINGRWENFKIVQEGMRQAVTEGTAKGLDTQAVSIAAKTGTAELGDRKQFVNSWTIGFFPYEKPKYAFAIVMERGPVKNLIGATYVMRQTIDGMAKNTPEYFSVE